MRIQLSLLCVCVAAVVATEHHDAALKRDDAVLVADKKDSLAAKKVPVADSADLKKGEEVKKAVEAAPASTKDGGDLVKESPVPTALVDKTWGEAVNSLAPTAEVFSANLGLYSKHSNVKPKIAMAFNLQEELEHWKKEGNPETLAFIGDDGETTYGIVSNNQPVLLTNYVDGITFHYFKKYNESDVKGQKVEDPSKLTDMGWDAKLPVKIITHGFTNTIRSPAIQLLKNAFLKSGKYNVVGVDWGKLCKGPWYPGARAHVSGAGVKVGEFVDALVRLKLTEPSLVHIMGHSLGAHVAGIAGKSMTMGKVQRITGLDPAGPLFQLTKPDGHIWRDDAVLVDIIHTNAGYLGKTKTLGHIDFFPNGGHFQPGCPFDVTGSCSHSRSYEYFAYTVRENRPIRGAYLCSTLPQSTTDCLGPARTEPAVTAEMGYPLKYKTEGAYFIKTVDKEPYEDYIHIVPFES